MFKVVSSVVILTEDPNVVNQLSKILIRWDCSIIIEKSKIKSIIKILEHTVDAIIVDTDGVENATLDLISIIRKTRPRLPIVVIAEDNSLEMLRTLAQLGIFYCIIKPFQSSEIEKVLEAITRIKTKDSQGNDLIAEYLQKQ